MAKLTTRLPSTLVGVMVAVALLPPAVTFGYMLGAGQLTMAAGAAALLAANIVCVNLSAQLVFLSKGIKPGNWIELPAAKQVHQDQLGDRVWFTCGPDLYRLLATTLAALNQSRLTLALASSMKWL